MVKAQLYNWYLFHNLQCTHQTTNNYDMGGEGDMTANTSCPIKVEMPPTHLLSWIEHTCMPEISEDAANNAQKK